MTSTALDQWMTPRGTPNAVLGRRVKCGATTIYRYRTGEIEPEGARLEALHRATGIPRHLLAPKRAARAVREFGLVLPPGAEPLPESVEAVAA